MRAPKAMRTSRQEVRKTSSTGSFGGAPSFFRWAARNASVSFSVRRTQTPTSSRTADSPKATRQPQSRNDFSLMFWDSG